MATRMYLVELKKKNVLVEAISVEAAIKVATAPMVKSCTLPSALEVARLMRDGVETIAPSLKPAAAKDGPPAERGEEGVGRMGLEDLNAQLVPGEGSPSSEG